MKRTTWRKIAVLLLAAVLLAACSTSFAAAEEKKSSAVNYNLWVGEEKVTSKKTSGSGWQYDRDSNTLTLDGFSYSGDGYKGKIGDVTTYTGIRYTGKTPLNIVLSGKNSIELNETKQKYNVYGVYSKTALTISGDGSLSILAGACGGKQSAGIWSDETVTLESGSVTAKSGKAEYSEGIWSKKGFIQKGGVLSLKADKASKNSYGVYVDEGDVTVSDGTMKAAGGAGNEWSLGIRCGGTVEITGGSVTAKGGKAKYSDGVDCGKGFIQKGGEVSLTAGEAKESSYGLEAEAGGVTVSGGTLNAAGGKSDSWSIGISCFDGGFTLENGTVKLTSDESKNSSYALYVAFGDVTVSSGTLNAKGGKAENWSCGIYCNKSAANFSGGDVTLISGDIVSAQKRDNALVTTGVLADKVTINGGAVYVETGNCYDIAGARGYCQGIFGYNGISVSGGEVSVKTGIANHESVGFVVSEQGMAIEGGTVTVAAGGLSEETVGEDEADFGSFAVEGDVSVKGGAASLSGETRAVLGSVTASVDGSGWADAAGTEGKADIASGESEQPLEYKKLAFPAQ